MQERFYQLADALCPLAGDGEVLLLNLGAEESDFVRFNRSAVRQPGHVTQAYLGLELIRGRRHASTAITLSGEAGADLAQASQVIEDLRALLPHVPDDPYLLYATDVCSGEQIGENHLPKATDAIDQVLAAGAGRDMVGIYAQGGIHRGFANSLGQRNWFSNSSFGLDWTFYHQADKAVKANYAGFAWDAGAFAAKVDQAAEQLAVLARPAKTVDPGGYRVFLTPSALKEILFTLSWGGFGLKSHRTKTTSLLKMIESGATLAPAVTLRENTKEGLAPNFQGQGFVKPDEVVLIDQGRYKDCLVSPRSAKEYGEQVNAGGEFPSSLDLAAGDLPTADVLARLDTGVYINTLWYLNYSDRPGCRITGMTRFATFWVEGGRIVAPLNVMRFDETGYRMLGENLLGLTAERDFLPSTSTYGGRGTDSLRAPGALIDDFQFTL